MTTYARIQNNVAVEIFVPPNGFTINQCFHPDIAVLFAVVPGGTVVGSVFANGAWTAPLTQSAPPAADASSKG